MRRLAKKLKRRHLQERPPHGGPDGDSIPSPPRPDDMPSHMAPGYSNDSPPSDLPDGVPPQLAACVATLKDQVSSSSTCGMSVDNLVVVGMHLYGIGDEGRDGHRGHHGRQDDDGPRGYDGYGEWDDEDDHRRHHGSVGGTLFVIAVIALSVMCCIRRRKRFRDINRRLARLEEMQRGVHRSEENEAESKAPAPAPMRTPATAPPAPAPAQIMAIAPRVIARAAPQPPQAPQLYPSVVPRAYPMQVAVPVTRTPQGYVQVMPMAGPPVRY